MTPIEEDMIIPKAKAADVSEYEAEIDAIVVRPYFASDQHAPEEP